MNVQSLPERVRMHFAVERAHAANDRRIRQMASIVAAHCPPPKQAPLIFSTPARASRGSASMLALAW